MYLKIMKLFQKVLFLDSLMANKKMSKHKLFHLKNKNNLLFSKYEIPMKNIVIIIEILCLFTNF